MTVQEAIHIAAEEAAWHRRVADDMEDCKNDDDVCGKYARKCERTAQALDTLLRVARAFERMGEE